MFLDLFRWTAAAHIDSLELSDVVPLGQGLALGYSVPWYLLAGFELEWLWKPWIQCRTGLKAGPDFPQFYTGVVNRAKGRPLRGLNYEAQAEQSFCFMERLRIAVAIATRAQTTRSFLKGVTPSLSL